MPMLIFNHLIYIECYKFYIFFYLYYSETLLSINGMTVFKQEAPSPTSNDMTVLQVARQHPQSPPNIQSENVVQNNTLEDNNSQNMFNNTINQLLSQTAVGTLNNVMESKYK